MCILNGRNCIKNDFTSVSVKGLSVVDYCLERHDALSTFGNFEVIRAADIIRRAEVANSATSIPDHSLITWTINLNSCLEADSESYDGVCSSFDKFDVSNIPNTFLSDQNSLFMVNEEINSLEASLRTQADVDTAYGDWCKLVSSNMYSTRKNEGWGSLGGLMSFQSYGIGFVVLSANG